MARPKKNTNTHALADKMRKAVLQAAIQGKLTQQDATKDGNARELLAQIETEKQRLVKAGEIKRQKSLPDITEEEKPFDIPDNWVWVRLGEIVLVNPRNKAEDSLEAAFIPMTFIQDGYNNAVTFEVREWGKIKKGYTHFSKNDVVLAKITPCFQNLKSAIIPDIPNEIGAGTTEIHVLRNFGSHVDLDYLLYFVKSPDFINNGVATFTGTAGQQRIGTDFVKEYLFPLPPLAEQQRIADKIKEVFLQIDDLQTDENALYALQTAFPRQMQASLLQAAIEGKLTQQDATKDGNAIDLLAEIESEKQRLIQAGELKRQKTLPPIIEEEKPFDIPDNWEWVRLGDVGIWQSGATPSRTESKYYNQGNIPWLKTGDLNDGLVTETSEKITKLALEKTSVTLQPIGAVLIAMYGATIGKLGLLEIESTTNQACCGCIVFKPVCNNYLFYFLLANRKRFIEMGAGGAQPNISKEKIINTVMPLPPLAEQQRIVDLLEQALPEIQTLKNI